VNGLKKALVYTAVVGPWVLCAGGIAMVGSGQWVVYSHEYAYAGIKFAPGPEAGCGVEIPTALGEAAGLEPFYCEQGNGWSLLPEQWYTTYYTED